MKQFWTKKDFNFHLHLDQIEFPITQMAVFSTDLHISFLDFWHLTQALNIEFFQCYHQHEDMICQYTNLNIKRKSK